MQFKIDTKEKFHVITIQENYLTANLSEELTKKITNCLESSIKNFILNMGEVTQIEAYSIDKLIEIQQYCLENGSSFVFCNLSSQMKSYLKDQDILNVIQFTPTENEAIEIVHMEEIEREMWDGA